MYRIYGYANDLRKVSGIQSIHSAQYYNNRYFRRQIEREDRRENKRENKREETFESKARKQELKKSVISGNQTIYKSTDPNIIYYMEYYKMRNTLVYRTVNTPYGTIDYKSNYNKYMGITNNNELRTKQAINAYNAQNKNKAVIDFEKRRQEIIKKRKENEQLENKITTKTSRQKGNKNTKSQSTKSRDTKKVMTKEEEMKEFKSSIRQNTVPKNDLDQAVASFQKAIYERKKYENYLKRNGFVVERDRKNYTYTVDRRKNSYKRQKMNTDRERD